MKPAPHSLLVLATALVLAPSFYGPGLQAQTNVFTTTPNSDYATPGNWSLVAIPGNGNNQQPWIGNNTTGSAIYSTATPYSTTSRFVVGIGNAGVASLTLNGSAGTLSFGGDSFGTANYVGVDGGTGTLTVSAGAVSMTNGASGGGHLFVGANSGGTLSTGTVVVNSGGSLTAGTRLLLGVNRTGNTGTLTINGGTVTIGSGASADADKGHLYLANSNGNALVNLNGGTLSLNRFNTTGTATSRAINFNGGTLQARATDPTFLTAGTTTVMAGGAIVDSNGFDITIATALAHDAGLGVTPDGGLTKTGTGVLSLSNVGSTFTGNINITQGTLSATVGNNVASATNSALGNATVARTVTVGTGATLSFNANDVIGNAASSPSLGLVVNGGTVTNNGTKFSTLGNVTLNGGTLTGSGGANGTYQMWSLAGGVTVGGSAASTISSSGGNAGVHLGSSSNNMVTFNVADATGSTATDLTVSAALIDRNTGQGGGAGGFTKSGAGTMVLSNVGSTFTGNIDVTQGTLSAAVGNNVASATNSALGNATEARTVTVGTGATLSFDANDVIGNAASIPSVGLVSNGGTVTNNGNKFSTLGNVTLNGGTLTGAGGANATYQMWSLAGGVTVGGSAASTISSSGTNAGVHLGSSSNNIVTFNVADATGSTATDLTVSAALINRNTGQGGGTGGLLKTGLGTMVLTGANSYTGGTTIGGGTLDISATGTTNAAGAIVVQNGGTLRLSRNDTWGTHTTGATAPITIQTGGVVQSNNTFTALIGLTLDGGTLSANDGVNANFPAFGLKGTVTVNATTGGSFISTSGVGDFNTISIGTGGAGGTTTFAVADGPASADLTVSVPLSNLAGVASNLLKSGPGTMVMSAANTYSGNTTVSGGRLLVNGSIGSGTVTVGAGATLGGSGTITTTSLTIQSGGTLAPGNSPQNLTVNGPVVLSPGAIFGVEAAVNGFMTTGDGTNGTDLLTVNGTIDLSGATLSGTWGGGPGNLFTGTVGPANMTWIVNNDSSDLITGTFANTTASPGLTSLFGTPAYFGSLGGQPVAVFYQSQWGVPGVSGLSGGNDLLLIAIPEPSRSLLALLALLPLVVRRRR